MSEEGAFDDLANFIPDVLFQRIGHSAGALLLARNSHE
jgi:hypothetical protein